MATSGKQAETYCVLSLKMVKVARVTICVNLALLGYQLLLLTIPRNIYTEYFSKLIFILNVLLAVDFVLSILLFYI